VNTIPRPTGAAFYRPLRLAVTALILAGVGLAVSAAILSMLHRVPAQLPVYAAVAVLLSIDAVLVWRQVWWAVLLTLAVLGGQVVAVAGIIVELTVGIADVKARPLHQLGVNPTAAVAINLFYSVIGVALFCWFVARWLTARRRG